MTTKQIHAPVVIIGGGPAGAATALALARLGVPAMILETHNNAYKPNEIVPANAYPLFRQLGIEYILHDTQHRPHVENRFTQGDTFTEECQQGYLHPGKGSLINRTYFEKQLRWAVERLKVPWLGGCSFIGYEDKQDEINITVGTSQGEQWDIQAAFAVDASGRAACLARAAGAKRLYFDQLTAYCMKWPGTSQSLRNTTIFEATGNGWWYATPEKGQQFSLSFMTDADLHEQASRRSAQWLSAELAATTYLKTWLATNADRRQLLAATRSAATSILDPVCTANWLAVGDAASAGDPIITYGIAGALQNALQAAITIKAHLTGDKAALATYAHAHIAAFNEQQAKQQQYYTEQTLWKDQPFWQRRLIRASYESSKA